MRKILPLLIAAAALYLTLAHLSFHSSRVLADDEPVTFTDVTLTANVDLVEAQFGASWTDYDKDGYPDVLVINHAAPPSLYHNNQDDTFTDLRAEAGLVPAWYDRHGVCWADYNNDSLPDLYIVTGRATPGSNFFVNNGDGTFTDQAVAAGIENQDGRGRSSRWADYDNDGDLDLFIANSTSSIAPDVLYRNNGDGSFTDVSVQAGLDSPELSVAAEWGDYDQDGYLDLAVARSEWGIKLYQNQRDGTFTETTEIAGVGGGWEPLGVAWGDYDNDGDLDLYKCLGYDGFGDAMMSNTNTLTFTSDVYSGEEEGIDFSTDGDQLILAFWNRDRFLVPSEIHIGESNTHPLTIPFVLDYSSVYSGTPVFSPTASGQVYIWHDGPGGKWHIRWHGPPESYITYRQGVITSNGTLSQVTTIGFDPVTTRHRANVLYQNQGDGTFLDVTSQAGVGDTANSQGANWVDFDNDGDLDLYVVNQGNSAIGNEPNHMYRNNGDGTFTDVAASSGLLGLVGGYGSCGAWADYNRDGFMDLFLTTNGWVGPSAGPHKLYRNQGNQNHWLQIELVGTVSNKQGVGAKVEVSMLGGNQFREAGIHSGSHCHDSSLVHFGLGAHTQVDVITVTWPSGIRQVLREVAADQFLMIVESESQNAVFLPHIVKDR